MPFSPKFSDVYVEIKKVIEDYAGFTCLRADELDVPGRITDDIRTYIRQARFLIADMTGSNANVFYEVGLCDGLNKPVVLLVQKGSDVPFDVKELRYLEYSTGDFAEFRKNLGRRVKGCLKTIPETWNKENTLEGPDVRITSLEAPTSAIVGQQLNITIKAKNFGSDAAQAYFSLSFPSLPTVALVNSDLGTKTGVKGEHWKSGQVILDYPIAEAYVYNAPGSQGPNWLRGKTHYLIAGVTPKRRGLLQFYISASAKVGERPFVNDPKASPLMDQREEPVYCGVIEVHDPAPS